MTTPADHAATVREALDRLEKLHKIGRMKTAEEGRAALDARVAELEAALRWYAEQSDNYMRAEAALQGKTMEEYRDALATDKEQA